MMGMFRLSRPNKPVHFDRFCSCAFAVALHRLRRGGDDSEPSLRDFPGVWLHFLVHIRLAQL